MTEFNVGDRVRFIRNGKVSLDVGYVMRVEPGVTTYDVNWEDAGLIEGYESRLLTADPEPFKEGDLIVYNGIDGIVVEDEEDDSKMIAIYTSHMATVRVVYVSDLQRRVRK